MLKPGAPPMDAISCRRQSANWAIGLAALGLILQVGCSDQPGRVQVVDVDPWDAAGKAIELYDSNGDQKLSDDELRAVPGILKWKKLYDQDSDSLVTDAEIAERLEKWKADKLGFRSISASVKLNGRPLGNVTVTLTPEPYLGDVVKPASGVTNSNGYAALGVAPDDLPEAIKERGSKLGGVYPGTYKITLSHPQRQLPDASRDGVPLGDEIARDTVGSSIEIDLVSR